jgi:hypothetical protein
MRIDAAGRVEFDRSMADEDSEEARAAAELAALRRDFPRFTIDRCRPPYGGAAYYAATRRPGEPGARPYHVARSDPGEVRRDLVAGALEQQGPGELQSPLDQA